MTVSDFMFRWTQWFDHTNLQLGSRAEEYWHVMFNRQPRFMRNGYQILDLIINHATYYYYALNTGIQPDQAWIDGWLRQTELIIERGVEDGSDANQMFLSFHGITFDEYAHIVRRGVVVNQFAETIVGDPQETLTRIRESFGDWEIDHALLSELVLAEMEYVSLYTVQITRGTRRSCA